MGIETILDPQPREIETETGVVVPPKVIPPSGPSALPRGPAYDRVIEEVNKMEELGGGWDSYGAAPISVEARRRAIVFVSTLLTHLDRSGSAPTVGPSPDGGVVFRWVSDKYDVIVTLLADGGEYSVVDLAKNNVIEEGQVGRPESLVRDIVKTLRGGLDSSRNLRFVSQQGYEPGQRITTGVIYRRIPNKQNYYDPVERRPTRLAFEPGKGHDHLSMALADWPTIEEILEDHDGYGLCELDAALTRLRSQVRPCSAHKKKKAGGLPPAFRVFGAGVFPPSVVTRRDGRRHAGSSVWCEPDCSDRPSKRESRIRPGSCACLTFTTRKPTVSGG